MALHLSRVQWTQLQKACAVRTPLRIPAANKSKLAPKKLPSTFALNHFDAFYPKVFGAAEWRSIRLALLSEKKYCAVINPHAETQEVHEMLEQAGAERMLISYPESRNPNELSVAVTEFPEHVTILEEPPIPENFQDSSRLIKEGHSEPLLSYVPATEMVYQEDVVFEEDYFNFLQPETEIIMKNFKPLPFPPLSVYVFPNGSVCEFAAPRETSAGLENYYLMDAASLLPVMALEIKEGDDFADFCAAPGGKTLAVAFQQKVGSHFCSDESPSRIQRLRRSIENYIPEELQTNIQIKHTDMLKIPEEMTFDKILIDVPCTNDRHSLHNDENSIFSTVRVQERLHLPQQQSALLKQALKKLRRGGVAVYSTCTLSPVQNDSVVHMSLQSFKTMKFIVTNLEETFFPLKQYLHIQKTRYGQLVLPYLPNNFGPMYICRIERIQ